MCSRHAELGAGYTDTLDIGCRDCGATYTASESHTCDSAQSLADAIATVEAHGLTTRPSMKMEGFREFIADFPQAWIVKGRHALDRADLLAAFDEQFPETARPILPHCIACSEPADPGDVYCRQHRLRIRDEDRL